MYIWNCLKPLLIVLVVFNLAVTEFATINISEYSQDLISNECYLIDKGRGVRVTVVGGGLYMAKKCKT